MQYVPPLNSTDPNASYVEGSPAAGLRGSFPTATGYEAMMREICNAIIALGLTPDPSNLDQLTSAIRLGGKLIACTDESTQENNTFTLAGTPTLGDYEPMQTFSWVPNFGITGNASIVVDGIGTLPLLRPDGSETQQGDVIAGSLTTAAMMSTLETVRLTALPASALASGEGIGLPGGKISLAFPSLIENDTISATDDLAFYANVPEGGEPSGHHYKINFAAFAAAVLALISAPVQELIPAQAAPPNMIAETQSGTYNSTPAARAVLGILTGAGGGGGGTTDSGAGAGGSAGATAIFMLRLTGAVSIPFAIGAGGTGGAGVAGNNACGGSGGNSTFGNYLTASGGGGQQPGGGIARATVAYAGGLVVPGSEAGQLSALLTLAGGTGASSTVPDGTQQGASGGSSFWGGGGAGGFYHPFSQACDGEEAVCIGAGGGGGAAGQDVSAVGGSGAPGGLLLIEFF